MNEAMLSAGVVKQQIDQGYPVNTATTHPWIMPGSAGRGMPAS